jgi:hypothetical protein
MEDRYEVNDDNYDDEYDQMVEGSGGIGFGRRSGVASLEPFSSSWSNPIITSSAAAISSSSSQANPMFVSYIFNPFIKFFGVPFVRSLVELQQQWPSSFARDLLHRALHLLFPIDLIGPHHHHHYVDDGSGYRQDDDDEVSGSPRGVLGNHHGSSFLLRLFVAPFNGQKKKKSMPPTQHHRRGVNHHYEHISRSSAVCHQEEMSAVVVGPDDHRDEDFENARRHGEEGVMHEQTGKQTKKPPLGRRPWNKKRRFLHENEEVVLVLTTGKVFQPIASSFNRSLGVF